MLKQSLQIFWLNTLLEYRNKSALNTALAFAISSLLTAIFAIGANEQSSTVKSGLIWLIILFAALNAIARLFVTEREQLTLDLLLLSASPLSIYWGKLAFNYVFLVLFSIPTIVIFDVMANLSIASFTHLTVIILLTNLALAAATTLLAAIVAESDAKAAIFPVISVPIIFPALIIAVELSSKCLTDATEAILWSDLLPLFGFCGALLSASTLLVDYIWDH